MKEKISVPLEDVEMLTATHSEALESFHCDEEISSQELADFFKQRAPRIVKLVLCNR